MKFGPLLKAYFSAEDGAYSRVTPREAADPQITADRFEKSVIYSVIPETSIYRGSKRSNPTAAMQSFIHYNSGEKLSAPLVFAKGSGNELRLYSSLQTGFLPKANDVWFVFKRDADLYIGSLPEIQWRKLAMTDAHDSEYQDAIDQVDSDSDVAYTTSVTAQVYRRNTRLGREALSLAGYKCEYEPSTKLFISRATGNPYLEAHHLIPLYATPDMSGVSLDIQENIIALSPHWHRAIHSAEMDVVSDMLKYLVGTRSGTLEKYNLSLKNLIDIYGGGKIG